MHRTPLWFGAAAALAALLAPTGRPAAARGASQPVSTSAIAAPDASVCPPRTIPDEGACVHLLDEGPDTPASRGAHRQRTGRWTFYDQIPRRPERPADYDAYRYPVPPGLAGGHSVLSGYDLDRPDEEQRRGARLRAVGHGGLDLPQARGTPVRLVELEHQEGPAEVLYVGPLFGNTVVTRHSVREAGTLRDYLVLFGHLERAADGLAAGQLLTEGALVGAVGDSGSPELVHLHLEVRRAREGAKLAGAGPALASEGVSVVCDPRNVLPLR
jgi:murein DD-endopeptidase MepM/ murein hydrolase activator NlpD